MANRFAKYVTGAPAVEDPMIAPPDPYKVADEQRAQQDQVLQVQNAGRDTERLRIAQEDQARQNKQAQFGTEGQGKAAGFLERAIGANKVYEGTGVGARSVAGEVAARYVPMITNVADTPERQQAGMAQRDFIAAVLRLESGAAISAGEFDNYGKLYFPQPGDDKTTVSAKAESRRRAMEALKMQAGPNGERLVIAPFGEGRGDDDRREAGKGSSPWPGIVGQDGKALPPGGGYGYDPKTQEWGLYGSSTDDSPAIADPRVAAEAARMDKITGPLGYGELAQHGLSLGMTDEAAGIGKAVGEALKGNFSLSDNYRVGRDAMQSRIDQARERLGGAAELMGSLAMPANALGRVATIGEAALGGAYAGGAAGFGYGRGAEQSGTNALLGAGAGMALGAGGQKLGNMLSARSNAPALAQRATELDAAGQAEGVTVNRAMVDPQSNNRITKADATLAGGRTIQRDMGAIEGQIEGRVADLGQGGRPMDAIAEGDTIRTAGQRAIDRTGASARKKYDRAEQLAGNAKVTPTQSLQAADDMIAQLGQTPGTNSGEIAFLETLKGDLSQDLSVGALRRMRTSLRKKISKGDLVFGEDEARVLGIMDAAADDIRTGLTQQGKQGAANAFDAADKSYRARMDYIENTIQRLIGKRHQSLPAEQVTRNFRSMANNDARGLRKFYASLDPAERMDVSATFAEALGKNNKGDFSVAHFLRQSEGMSDAAVKTIFGPEGAQSIANLRKVGAEVQRVTGAMNSRTSKSGVASYRDWMFSLLSGGGLGALGSGGNLVTTGAAAAAGAAAKGSHDAISARLLMSPKISKWLLQAPSTTNPAAINAHFARLGEIAKAEPALTGEIDSLRRSIMGAANDNVGFSAAAESPQERKNEEQRP